MNSAQTLYALCRREFLDGKTAFVYVPGFIFGFFLLMVILSLVGIGNGISIDDGLTMRDLAEKFSEAVEREGGNVGEHVTAAYWVMSIPVWMTLPFVVFFGLSGALYDERKDRSILFFKSMPVADWQEVVAKLVTIAIAAPLAYLAITFVAQLAFAFVMSIAVLFHGGPVLELWPLFTMVETVMGGAVFALTYFLWAAPIFGWILLASAFAPKVPFLFAAFPPVVLSIIEVQIFGHSMLAEFLLDHVGRGMAEVGDSIIGIDSRINGPDDLLEELSLITSVKVLLASFAKSSFWVGQGVAAVLVLGAIEARRRAN